MISLDGFSSSSQVPLAPVGWYDYSNEVLDDGTLALVRADFDFVNIHRNDDIAAWQEARLRISTFNGKVESEAIELNAIRYPLVDRFADGSWLVAGARALTGASNVSIFSKQGTKLSSLAVGDGIGQVIAGSDDRIWISYFDEGIVGSPEQNGTAPPGSSGLAAFEIDGRCRWRFDFEDYWIADCSALSSNGRVMWICTYPDFPIFSIDGEQVRKWKNGISGVSAIAANSSHVILAGGYGANMNRIVLLHLDAERAVVVAEVSLPGDGQGVTLLRGRNGVLHAVTGQHWFRVGIDDWLTMLSDENV